ncbi:MAG: VanZ family protein [Planctomycetota bacterium]
MPVVAPAPRRRLARPLAAVTAAYTLVLVFATHYPRPEELLGPNPPSDKTLHFAAYGLLGLFVAATLAAAGRWSRAAAGLLFIALAAFAALDEATQPLFGRSAEPVDWVYDVIGIAAGITAVAVARTWLKSRSPVTP